MTELTQKEETKNERPALSGLTMEFLMNNDDKNTMEVIKEEKEEDN